MTTQTIAKIACAAFDHFNSKMKTNYTSDNVKLAFYDNSDADLQWLSQNNLTHFISIVNLVYIHIRSEKFWKIDEDFIETLGSAYFAVLAQSV